MDPEQLQKAIENAKANPNDPRSKELRRRMESGLLNPELKAAGMDIFEPKKEEVPAPGTTSVGFTAIPGGQIPGLQTGMPQPSDAGQDIKETFFSIVEDVKANTTRGAEVLESDQDPFSKGLQLAGTGAKTAVDIVENLFVGALKVVASQETEDKVKDSLSSLMQTKGGQFAIQALQKGEEGWSQFSAENPTFASNVEALVPVAEMFGFGAATRPAKAAVETVKETVPKVAEKVQEAAVDVAGKTGAIVDEVVDARKTARIERLNTEVDEAVGRIIQGGPEDIAQAKRAFSNIDTGGVKTHTDLNTRIDEKVEVLSKQMNKLLDQQEGTFKSNELALRSKVTAGGKEGTAFQTPVDDALAELSDFYKKTGNTTEVERMRILTEKLEAEGLTLREINDLARQHGKDLSAFNAQGELASGLSKQSAENTRKGLKTTVRDRIEGEVPKELDSQISDLLNTQPLIKKMEEKVLKLDQRLRNPTVMDKIKRSSAIIGNVLTLGSLERAFPRLLPGSRINESLNVIELEKEISRNLKKVDKLLEIDDPRKLSDEFVKYMEEIQLGLSTRVVSGLDEPKKDLMLTQLQDLTSQSAVIGDEIDLDLSDAIDRLQKAAERPRGLTEAEFVELRFLLDEIIETPPLQSKLP